MDERYLLQRERAGRIALWTVQTLLCLAVLVALFISDHLLIAYELTFLLILSLSLRQVIFAWIEPDPPPDSD